MPHIVLDISTTTLLCRRSHIHITQECASPAVLSLCLLEIRIRLLGLSSIVLRSRSSRTVKTRSCVLRQFSIYVQNRMLCSSAAQVKGCQNDMVCTIEQKYIFFCKIYKVALRNPMHNSNFESTTSELLSPIC